MSSTLVYYTNPMWPKLKCCYIESGALNQLWLVVSNAFIIIILLLKPFFSFLSGRRPSTIDQPHPSTIGDSWQRGEREKLRCGVCAFLYREGQRSQVNTSANTGTQSVFVLPLFFNPALFSFPIVWIQKDLYSFSSLNLFGNLAFLKS